MSDGESSDEIADADVDLLDDTANNANDSTSGDDAT